MDFHLKQWRNQQCESEQHQQQQQEQEEQHSAKIPKLLRDHHQPYQIKPEPSPVSSAALPLFVPDHQPPSNNNNKVTTTHLSVAFPHQSTTPVSSSRHPRGMGSYFSLAQWQELELQALIFRYMLAGAAVPPELLQPIKKSFNNLFHNPYFLHNHPALQPYNPHHFQPPGALFQTGCWGRGAMDREPGRCRRTDGKKWRCSRDVVVGQKYCERHMHRGRNRSRKPVETPTPATALGRAAGAGAGGGGGTLSTGSAAPIGASPLGIAASGGTHFSLSGPSSSIDPLHLNRSSSDVKRESKDLFEPHNEVSGDCKSGGHILRHFFDDWPRSLQEPDNATQMSSSNTSLSISVPGNLSSDVSLKLSTGDGDEPAAQQDGHVDRDHNPQLGWASGWGSNPMASMGGPLAEALRSSNSNSSPTSVLHQLPRGSASETCIVSS